MKYLLLIPVLCIVGFGCSNKQGSSRIVLQQQESPADFAISTKVKEVLNSNSSLSSYVNLINVTTKGGVVKLTGNVAKQKDADKIVKMTQKIEGVQSIDNQLVVKSS